MAANRSTDASATDAGLPAVELRGISKSFGLRKVLDAIDIAVAQGEILAIVGPSGCGKTTLLKIISGIETADRGEVLLSGRDCTSLPAYRRPVHTVFQNYALFPHLDVASNVAFPLGAARVPRAEREMLVAQALSWVQLLAHARRNVDSLSGGERQRVALARALVDSPQCVLLDEPLSALDPHLRAQTLELLKDIQRRLGTTFIFITHDRDEALRLGHRVGVLNAGRLEQVGTPEDIYRRPRTPFVASFIGKINWIAAQIVDAGGQRALIIGDQPLSHDFGDGVATGAVRLGVRPEDIEIGPDGWLVAQVTAHQFVGGMKLVELRLDSGAEVCVHQRVANGDLSIGQQVRLKWAPAAAHVFPENGEAPA